MIINEDPVRRGILLGFKALIDGSIPKDTLFKMYDDKLMKEYLDSEDFAFWVKEKAAFLSSS